MKKIIILIFALLLAVAGCGLNNQKEATNENIDLYFALKGNTGLEIEQRSIKYLNTKEKYVKALEEWVKGPTDTNKFEKSVSTDVKVLSASLDQDKLTVDLSKEFNSFNGSMHESATIAALVNTMVRFPEVNSVKINIEGVEMTAPSGNPYGYLTEIQFNPNSQGQLQSRMVVLYFADDQAMNVVAENRIINIDENASKDILIKTLIEEMIKGPQSTDIYASIPEEARVNSVTVSGERVTIDFSEEMLTKHSKGAAGEDMTLTSIVNTVTEVEGIREVVLTVNGQPLNIEHAIIDNNNPLTRDESRILKK